MAGVNDNKIVMNSSGLVARSYNAPGGTTDSGLVTPSDGTSLDQFSIILGLLNAYETIGDPRALVRAEQAVNAILPILLRGTPVSATANNVLPHWLFNVKYEHDGIAMDQVFESFGGIRPLNAGEIKAEMRMMLAAPRALNKFASITGKTMFADMAQAIIKNARDLASSIGVMPRWIILNTQTGEKLPSAGYPVWAQLGSSFDISMVDTIAARLQTMQTSWQTALGELGPFAPMFNRDTGQGDWNTLLSYDVGGHGQYWALTDLSLHVAASPTARGIVIEFLDWLATDANWLPNAPSFNDKLTAMINRSSLNDFQSYDEVQATIDAVTLPKLGPPDFYRATGAAHVSDDPCFAAMVMEAAVHLDNYQRPSGTGSIYLSVENVIHKAMAIMQVTYRNAGEMAGTFADGNDWTSYKHGAMMSAISYTLQWAQKTKRPSIETLCREWLSGMVKWVDANTRRAGSPWGARPWPFEIDWASGMTESIEFSTNVITSRSGREQRISRRRNFRRRLSYNYTMLTSQESSDFQAILKSRQNSPAMVPQWQFSMVAGQFSAAGTNVIQLAETPPDFVEAGVPLIISQGGLQQLTYVREMTDTTLTLEDELDFPVFPGGLAVPSVNAIIDASTSSTKLSASYMQAVVGFQVLPQEDYRTLANRPQPGNWISFISTAGFLWAKYINNASLLEVKLPLYWPEPGRFDFPIPTFTVGSETRELIDRRPNWASAVSVDDTWSYDLVSYDAGPITPMGGESFGRRTVKATWTFFTKEDREDFESLLKRLRGMQVACWIPSWTRDFEMQADMTLGNRLVVQKNAFIDEGLFNAAYTGICIMTKGGGMLCARVASSVINGDQATLTLDRDLGFLVKMDDVAKISALYRVRQASDTAEIHYHTKAVAECSISFVTVNDGPVA
ncbi:tail assembly protein [Pseudomonas phage UF_RH7]|nr:tail assembly protein [Pseudomonas phage UF_RH7]